VNKKLIFMTVTLLLLLAVSAVAQETAPATGAGTTTAAPTGVRWNLIAASFLLAIAAFGGAIGQSRGLAAAVEGIARNPSAGGLIRNAMIIGLALIESLVIYALIIAYMIMGS
jgi:F-type H+-transporting ATPase subunit c